MTLLSCDVALIVPLAEEFKQLCDARKMVAYRLGDEAFCYRTLEGKSSVFVTVQREMGNGPAMETALLAGTQLRARSVLCAGIGGSLRSDDLRLGEIAVSRRVFDIADAAKLKDRGRSYELLTVSRPLMPTPKIVALAQSIETLDPSGFKEWKQGCQARLVQKGMQPPDSDWPRVECCDFATGLVVASDNFDLTSTNRELKVIETEASGIGRAAGFLASPFAVIRGISDYADRNKGSLQKDSKNAWRNVAAHNALEFALLLGRQPEYLESLPARRKFFILPRAATIDSDSARMVFESAYALRPSSGTLEYLRPHLDSLHAALASLRLLRSPEEERGVVTVLIDLSRQVLFSADEGSGDRLDAADSIFERVASYVRSRSDTEIRQTIGLEYHHFAKTIAIRRDDYTGALVHARAAHQIAHERGDTNAELIALRCLSCVQAEALSPEVAPAAEGLYQLVRNIDAQAAALNDQRVSIETRIHHLLVAVRIRLYAGLFDEHYRNTLDSAIQLLSDSDSAPNADPSQLRRLRALVDAYEAAWDVWVRKIPPDTSRLARIGAWIREDGRADYCLIRWPLDRRSLLSRAAAAAEADPTSTTGQLPAKDA
jgi:nucleoside phosphorylase